MIGLAPLTVESVHAMLVEFAESRPPGRLAVSANERTWRALGARPTHESTVGRKDAVDESGSPTVLLDAIDLDRCWKVSVRKAFDPRTLGDRYGVRMTTTVHFEPISDEDLPDGFVAIGRANAENVVATERGIHGALPT